LYSAQLVGVYNYGEMPEELSGFVYFQAARENRKPRKGDKVAMLVIEGTTSYVVAFLDTLRSVDELERRLEEQEAKMTEVSKVSLERVLREMHDHG
jgi:hypothetical protein